jgi:hypothetical protein
MAYRCFVQWIWHRLGRYNRKILPACVVRKIRETFPSEEYCGLNTLLFEQHLFEKCTIAMNCELYTLQIIIYNLHVELNFNVHTVFSLSAKS